MSIPRTTMPLLTLLFVVVGSPVSLAGAPSCDGLSWPLETERIAFSRPDLVSANAGGVLTPDVANAFELLLAARGTATRAIEPTGKPKLDAAQTFEGTVSVDNVLGQGAIQVTLADEGWIDVVQRGKALPAVAHTGSKSCPGIRKSVKFMVDPGPFVVQVTGATTSKLKVSIRRVGE
ncbi:MAG: hypothetical protein WC807_16005 [Hyphomicrobium sp.]